MATDKHATMEATSVFFVVCPKATIGAAVFSLRSVTMLANVSSKLLLACLLASLVSS
jgi:hypothetical protein